MAERNTSGYASRMVKEARLRMGYSQQKVSTIIGVNLRQYQRFEYGQRSLRNSSMRIGLAVCAALEIDPFILVFGEEPEELDLIASLKG